MKRTIVFLFILTSLSGLAQEKEYTLQQCIDQALDTNAKVKNATIDLGIVENDTKELKSKVLPHVEADANLMHNFNIQKIVLENGAIPAFTDPTIPSGEVIAFQLQLKNSLTASLNASQVIFDKSLFESFKATDLKKELGDQSLEKEKIDVVVGVTKAYYSVLISQQQLEFLESNLDRIETVYADAEAKLKSGLVRPIDVNRIEVALNNIKDEEQTAQQNVALSKAALGYLMHNNAPDNIQLSGTLDESVLYEQGGDDNAVNYSDRVEYNMLETQQKLNEQSLLIHKGMFYPRLSAFATTGVNPAATNLGDIFQSDRYFNYSYVGLRLQVPIFNGMEKTYQSGTLKLQKEKIQNNLDEAQQFIDNQVEQADIRFNKSLQSIKLQKRNLELAEENVKSIKFENEHGVANTIEVVDAETDLRLAQNKYYNALYQAVTAKIDLEKAKGAIRNY
ncbi:MAG: TolC family protein [Cyclobacteriaceae bacterium]|nr:TolC family protein [Cyclobacteriaceae bacterium]